MLKFRQMFKLAAETVALAVMVVLAGTVFVVTCLLLAAFLVGVSQ